MFQFSVLCNKPPQNVVDYSSLWLGSVAWFICSMWCHLGCSMELEGPNWLTHMAIYCGAQLTPWSLHPHVST